MDLKGIITIFTVSFGGCLLILHFIPESQVQVIGIKFIDIGFIMWIELWKTIHHDLHSILKAIKLKTAKVFQRKKDKIKKIERCGIL